MSFAKTNQTDDVDGSDALPEPQPDWSEAIRVWGTAWTLHVYGFGALHVTLCLYSIYSVVKLRRKLLPQHYVIGIASFVVIMSLFRIFFLLVDPYQSRDILPHVLVRMLNALVYPCIIAMFTLLQVIIVRFTKLSVNTASSMRTHRMLIASLVAYFLSTAAITLVVGWRVELKFLILFIQGVFISWGLIVCFSFVYNGFKVAQFTSEANRALKEFTRYSRIRKEAIRSGKPRDLALHRITRPRMRDEAEMLPMDMDASAESGENSSDSISFFNEAFGENSRYQITLVRDRERDDNVLNARTSATTRLDEVRTSMTSADVGHTDSLSDCGRESDEPSGSSPQITSLAEADRSQSLRRYRSSTSRNRARSDTLREVAASVDRQPFRTCRKPFSAISSYLTRNGLLHANKTASTGRWPANETFLVQTNKAFDPGSSPSIAKSVDNDAGAESTPFVRDPEQGLTPSGSPPQAPPPPAKDTDPGDGGYMADTEPNSPQILKSRHTHARPKPPNTLPLEGVDSTQDSPRHAPYPLPLNDGSMGLYRILQGRALGQVHKMVYFATLFVFITCIMKLYAMFGVYGVLTKDTTAEMWPWFIFNTCARFSELGAASLISWVTFTLARKRWRIRRKRKLRTKEITTC